MSDRSSKSFWIGVLLLLGTARAATLPNPFFAMDTAVRELGQLDTVRQLGYAGIGWKVGPPEQIAEAASQARIRGLHLFAVYGSATLTPKGLTWDPQIEANIVALKGSQTILWLPLNGQGVAPSSTNADALAVPALRRLAEFAAANQVKVALYPHAGCWAERVQDAVRLAKQVGNANLGVTFNLCHCLKVGDEARIPDLLADASPYLFVVTINGADAGGEQSGWDRLIRPLDEGSYDVGIVLRKLKELRYQGPIGLQAFGVNLPPATNLERSMHAWRKLNP